MYRVGKFTRRFKGGYTTSAKLRTSMQTWQTSSWVSAPHFYSIFASTLCSPSSVTPLNRRLNTYITVHLSTEKKILAVLKSLYHQSSYGNPTVALIRGDPDSVTFPFMSLISMCSGRKILNFYRMIGCDWSWAIPVIESRLSVSWPETHGGVKQTLFESKSDRKALNYE
jgi:hypothetical protein